MLPSLKPPFPGREEGKGRGHETGDPQGEVALKGPTFRETGEGYAGRACVSVAPVLGLL